MNVFQITTAAGKKILVAIEASSNEKSGQEMAMKVFHRAFPDEEIKKCFYIK